MGSPEAPWQPRFAAVQVDLIKALGRGAFGEVSLVKASPSGAEGPPAVFALKRTSLAQISEAGLEHAQSEAKLLQRLGEEHESILQCFDFRVVPGAHPALELLLEFAPLGDLSGRIRAHKESEAGRSGGLPESEVVSCACDVAAGLAHIHSLEPKVLHRDVKPANVVLFPTVDGDAQEACTPRAKLADFGIAKVLEADGSVAGANTVIGTPHYFSPEICRGESYDERSDAWALGCVIYEMMCLHRPFHKSEGNIAVLALRVMEGRYDKEALVRQAGCYNGLLIFALTGLMTTDPQQRSRASEVLQPLHKLRDGLAGGAAGAAVPWWRVDISRLAATGAAGAGAAAASSPPSAGGDSWQGAHGVDLSGDPQTVFPLQEAVTAVRSGTLPSPQWKRTGELLLDAATAPYTVDPRASPDTVDPRASPATVDPRASPDTVDPRASPATVDPRASPATVDPRASPDTLDPRASPATVDPRGSPDTLDPRGSPFTVDPRASPEPMPGLSRAVSSPSGVPAAPAAPERQRTWSPFPESTFHLSETSTLQGTAALDGLGASQELPEASGEASMSGTARFGWTRNSDPLGETSGLGETVRLDFQRAGARGGAGGAAEPGGSRTDTPAEDCDDATVRGMAPSRIAWQGMTGMFDMMSEPPPAGGLGQTLRSEASVASACGWQSPSSEAEDPAEAATQQQQGTAAGGGGGSDQTFWAEPRIFLRPLWRPTGAGPAPPDAPVMFCFTREDSGPQQAHARQPCAEEAVPEGHEEEQDFAEADCRPESFGPCGPEPSGAAAGCPVLTGRGSVLDPAHGWLEVELTVENAAALYAHMRGAAPQPQPQPQPQPLGGIFELTAVS